MKKTILSIVLASTLLLSACNAPTSKRPSDTTTIKETTETEPTTTITETTVQIPKISVTYEYVLISLCNELNRVNGQIYSYRKINISNDMVPAPEIDFKTHKAKPGKDSKEYYAKGANKETAYAITYMDETEQSLPLVTFVLYEFKDNSANYLDLSVGSRISIPYTPDSEINNNEFKRGSDSPQNFQLVVSAINGQYILCVDEYGDGSTNYKTPFKSKIAQNIYDAFMALK